MHNRAGNDSPNEQTTPKTYNQLIIVLHNGLSGQSALPNELIHIHNVAPLLNMTFELIIQVQSIASALAITTADISGWVGGALIGRLLVADE